MGGNSTGKEVTRHMSRLGTSRAFTRLFLLCILATATAVRAAELFQYEAAEFEKGRLQYIDGLPVMELEGSPAEMGRQAAALTSHAAKQLIGYPKKLATTRAGKRGWAKVEKTGRPLLANFPPHHKEELEAFARQAGIDTGTVAVANVMVDVYRVFGCWSSRTAAPPVECSSAGISTFTAWASSTNTPW